MALTDKKPKPEAAAVLGEESTLPGNTAFETETETANAAGASDATHTDEAVAAASTSATKAIAKAATTSLANPTTEVFGAHLPEDMKVMLRELDFGVLPRIVADQGGLSMADEKIDLGKWVKAQILDVQNSFIASPGSDTEEAKKLVKFSKDGINLDDGSGPAAQYIEQMRAEGYKDAELKHYINVIAMLQEADDAEAAEDLIGNLVVIQLSPQSRKKFHNYMLNARMKSITKGSLDGLDFAKFSAIKKSGPGRNWTEIETSLAA